MKKRIFKIMSFLVSVMLFSQVIMTSAIESIAVSTNTYTEITTEKDNETTNEKFTEYQFDENDVEILGEDKSLREEKVKYFNTSDPSIKVTAAYNDAVHYKKDGQWVDINNDMQETVDVTNEVLENKNNKFKVKFSKTADKHKLVSLKQDNYNLSWNVEGAFKSSLIEETSDLDVLNAKKQVKDLSLNNINSKLKYKEIFKDVDLVYDIVGDKIKESIILHNKNTAKEFVFNYKYNKLDVKKVGNDIVFFEKGNESKIAYYLEAPFMIDASGVTSYDVTMELIKGKHDCKIIMKADDNWLKSSDRKYPVIIDPTVSADKTATNISDTFVASKKPYDNMSGSVFLFAGVGDTNGIMRTYVKINVLPQIPVHANIVQAYSTLTCRELNGRPLLIDVRRKDVANYQNLNYSTQPSDVMQGTVYDSVLVDKSSWTYAWDMTAVARQWYESENAGNANLGLVFTSRHENSATNFACFVSSNDTANSQYVPSYYMYYTSYKGVESYWSNESYSAGRAGTAIINHNSGRLTVTTPTEAATSGNRMPVSVSHVYNSDSRNDFTGINPQIGRGWSLSCMESVRPLTGFTDTKYEYTDSDGTIHYFNNDLKDTSGLDLTISVSGDIIKIKDKKDNEKQFIKIGTGGYYYLSKTIDSNSNTRTVTYTDNKISKITDGAGRSIIFNSGMYLSNIVDPSNRQTVYNYNTDGYLTKIIYPDGKYAQYTYYGDKLLATMKDSDGNRLTFYYTNTYKKRVSIVERYYNDVLQDTYTFEYGNNITKTADKTNKKVTYQMNNFGQTTGTVDWEGNGVFSEYGFSKDKVQEINKLKKGSKIQKYTENLLSNHSFEQSSADNKTPNGWTVKCPQNPGGIGSAVNFLSDNTVSLFGLKSEKMYSGNETYDTYIEKTFGSETFKTAGEYTFTAYIKSGDDNGGSLTGTLTNLNSKGAAICAVVDNKEYYSEYINGKNDWKRVSVSFTVPAGKTVKLRLGLFKEKGIAYFDGVKLEKGGSVNRYNILTNPGFDDELNGWTKNSAFTGHDKVENTPGRTGAWTNTVCIWGDETWKTLYQRIPARGKKGDIYSYSGWSKGRSLPQPETGSNYYIEVVFRKNGANLGGGEFAKKFSTAHEMWQFIAGEAIAPSDYDEIEFRICYIKNANTAYFDDLTLCRETFGESYTYDEKGNIISIVDKAANDSKFDYNGNNDLVSMTLPTSSKFTYQYDNGDTAYKRHNLTKATSAKGTQYMFDYDDAGNNTSLKVLTSNNYIEMNTSATYTPDKAFVTSVTDADGVKTWYGYDDRQANYANIKKGLVTATRLQGSDGTQDPIATTMTYDNNTDSITGVTRTGKAGNSTTNSTYSASYAYTKDMLTGITTKPGMTYNFDYNYRGQLNFMTYPYSGNANKFEYFGGYLYDELGRLTRERYRMGAADSTQLGYLYYYDNLNRLSEVRDISSSSVPLFKYTYDDKGNISSYYESPSDCMNRYYYDLTDRLTGITSSKGYSIDIEYDKNNNISKTTEKQKEIKRDFVTENTYNADNLIEKIKVGTSSLDITYDGINRINKTVVKDGGSTVIDTFNSYYDSQFPNSPRLKASSRLKSVTNKVNDNSQAYNSYYEYDNYGRISKYQEILRHNLAVEVKKADTTYTYDDFGQLKTSSNAATGKDRRYEYSSAGNLSSVKENGTVIKSFTYDSVNKDLLTKYNNKDITWHNGLLLNTYNGSIYTWKYDQRLAQISMPSKTISFGYNDEGIRTKKTVGGKTTEYVLDGSQVLFEKRSDETVRYEYDNNGLPLLMEIIPMGQTEGSKYYYIKNGMGDVIGLVDKNCNVVVEYTYDDYGYITSKTGSLKDTVGTKNPYRYRSYRYDEETGLYYLNARYYNPEWGRFISADSEGLLSATMNSYNDKNLFAYCDANPVCRTDISGNSWFGDIWKRAKKFIKKVVKSVFYSSYGEAGIGYGIGASSSVGGVTAYHDPISVGFKEGETYTGISGKAGGNIKEGKYSIGFGVSYSHKYKDGPDRNLEPHTTSSSPIEVYNCPLTEVSKKLLVALDNEDVKFEIGGSFHIIVGGHAKLGFNSTKFFKNIFEGVEDE